MTNSRRTSRGPVLLMPGPGTGLRPGAWGTLPYVNSKVPVLRPSYTRFPCQVHTFLVYDTFSTKIGLCFGRRWSLYLCNQTQSPALFHPLYRRHRETCVRLAQALCGSFCGMASLNTVPRRSVVAKSDRVCIDAPVPNGETVHKYWAVFRATKSVLGIKRTHRRHELTEEKTGEDGRQLQHINILIFRTCGGKRHAFVI